MISSGMEPATFRLVAKCLSQLRYRVEELKKYVGERKVRHRQKINNKERGSQAQETEVLGGP
jgi:hypothetical protein